MPVDRSPDQPDPKRTPDSSRDDRILEALALFRYDVMKEIVQIKEALKVHPESPRQRKATAPKRRSSDCQAERGTKIGRIEKQKLFEESLLDNVDSVELKLAGCLSDHSMGGSAFADSRSDIINSLFDPQLPPKRSRDFVKAATSSSVKNSFSLQSSVDNRLTSQKSDCDVIPASSSLRKTIVNKQSPPNRQPQPCTYTVGGSETEQEDYKDFVKEEVSSDSALSDDPFPLQVQSARSVFPSSSRQTLLSSASLLQANTTSDGSTNSMKAIAGLFCPSLSDNLYEGTKTFVCTICCRQFRSSSNLKVHTRVHTREKPYKCNDCDKRFTTTSNLKVHIRTHTGERPYKCTHCHKAFINHSNLKKHSQIHVPLRRQYPDKIPLMWNQTYKQPPKTAPCGNARTGASGRIT